MILKGLVLLAFGVIYASAENVPTYDCPNVTTHTKDVVMQVSHCQASFERCPLYQGKTHNVLFKFTTLKNYTGKIDFRVYGVFEKFTVPYKGKSDAMENAHFTDNAEPVKDLGMFVAGREIKHMSDFAVSTNYPKIELRVRFIVQERRTKEIIMCRELPVGIMSPPGEQTAE